MPENKSRFVLACQQALAVAVVVTVGLSAAGVVRLEIVSPGQDLRAGGRAAPEGALVSSAPVRPTVRTVPLGGGSTASHDRISKSGTPGPGSQRIRVLSAPETATGFATVGVTWDAGQRVGEDGIRLSVRTRADGSWSAWEPMTYDPYHEPDPGQESSRRHPLRDGTDAVVIGKVDKVQVRVVSRRTTPTGLALAIVDPGKNVAPEEQAPAIDTGTLSSATAGPDGTATLASATLRADKPQIFSRKQWGADESLRDPGSLHYGKITAGFVHHTVNANDYSRSDVPAIIRGIYAYHVRSRGWSDIGYNFLVDRFGRIWEGRYGGVDRPVVGAHTLGYNESSFAMSAIGNYEIAKPSEAMVQAYARLFAWKLAISGVRADDTRQWVESRYLQAINGHSDAGQTACPGRYLYARLPDIRRMAAAIQDGAGSPPPTPGPGGSRDLDANMSGSRWPDLLVRDPRSGHAVIVRTGGQVGFGDAVTGARNWDGMDLVAAPGDLTGDGVADLIARDGRTGEAQLFPGSGQGTLLPPVRSYRRFAGDDQLSGVGDFDGDGTADLVGRSESTGELLLYPGLGTGAFGLAVELASGWPYDLTTGVGDFNSDGHPDLVARSGADLFLVPGTGTSLGSRVQVPGSWARFDVITGRGDVTGDREPDLVARARSTGTTYIYPGDGANHLGPRTGGYTRFKGMRWMAVAGRLAGQRKLDLATVNRRTGALRVFANTGRRNLGAIVDTGARVAGADLLLDVGDWDGDGRNDVMSRVAATGALEFRAGRPHGQLAPPVTAAADWSGVTGVAAVGDITGDGLPDLVGRSADGSFRIYPGDGDHGFKRSIVRPGLTGVRQVALGRWDGDKVPDTAVLHRDGTLWLVPSQRGRTRQVADGLQKYDWLVGLGDVNGDRRPDLVARDKRRGYLWLLPGHGDGFASRRLIGTGFGSYDLG